MVSKMRVIVYFLPHLESLSQELLLSKHTKTASWVLACSSMLQNAIIPLSEVAKQGLCRLGASFVMLGAQKAWFL